ncbi:DUF2155 domain-containing protein [Parasphingorhabdus sp. JC815]|uniref:DUF2155 domain-containing protein n=1 Tax=Parasphingorhabdus sp. JC815 TaxID=3232140 RepID=UPI00345774C3
MMRGRKSSAYNKSRFLPVCASLFLSTAMLSGCGWFDDSLDEESSGQPAEKAELEAATDEELVQPVGDQIGTPMAERVATLGFLNKRNGLTRDLELKPGQSIRVGRAIVRLRACERTAPWELHPEQGAFVQLLVNDRPIGKQGKDRWQSVFSGWLFRESPSINVVEHPIYDVWVKSCAMSFPGEENAPGDATDPTAPRSSASNLANSASSAENDGSEGNGSDDEAPLLTAPLPPATPERSVSPPAVNAIPDAAPETEPDSVETLDELIAENIGE